MSNPAIGRAPIRTVALLSDVHGVLPALEAVLAEPEVRDADLVVVTGDHAAGPQPVQVLDRLTGLGDRVLLVRGNADRELVSLARDPQLDAAVAIDSWAARQLRPDQVFLLAALPHPATIRVAGTGTVVCCHGTPRDDNEVVLVDTRPERWLQALAGLGPEVTTVVCGHTHMPFARLVDRRLVVNPGSVGMPYGRSGAHWGLLADGAVTLRRTPLGPEAAAAVIAGSDYPERADWVREYLIDGASDLEALATFGPRDGR